MALFQKRNVLWLSALCAALLVPCLVSSGPLDGADIGLTSASTQASSVRLAQAVAVEGEGPALPRGIEPPPFILPRDIADYLVGLRTFTDQELAQANFNGQSNGENPIDVGDIVTRVNQIHPGPKP